MNDAHYTQAEIAKELMSKIDLSRFDYIVEPSAGGGSFSDSISSDKRIAIDIDPKKDYMKRSDFLVYDFSDIRTSNILTIGNPPFGFRAQSAIEFFNKAATYSSTIAFIVPCSFRKQYVIDQLHRNFHLMKDKTLRIGSFETNTNVRTCWQIWEKRKEYRLPIKLSTTSMDFDVVSTKDVDDKSKFYGIRRTSFGIDSIADVVEVNKATPRTQFILVREKKHGLMNRLKKLKSKLQEISYECTALSPTFTVGELVETYNKKYQAYHNLPIDFS